MKKRRKYTSVKNPVLMAIENASVISPKRNAEYKNAELKAIGNMARGEFGNDEWVLMVDITNMAEMMARMGIGHEVIPVAAEAQVVLAKVRKEFADNNVWRIPQSEVFALRELQEYHDLQRQSIHYGQYLQIAKKIRNLVRGGHMTTYADILEEVNAADQHVRSLSA